MKTFKQLSLLLILCLPCLSSSANSHKREKSSDACLRISGCTSGIPVNSTSSTIVCLSKDNHEVCWQEIKPGKFFTFDLERNAYYSIIIWNPDFITRTVSVDTHLPEGVSDSHLFQFEFEMTMQPKDGVTEKNDDYDFPVAIVSYQQDKKCFDYSRKYTALVKRELDRSQSLAKDK